MQTGTRSRWWLLLAHTAFTHPSPFVRVVRHVENGRTLASLLGLAATFSRALEPRDSALPSALLLADPATACLPIAPVPRGSCVLVERGACAFDEKAMNAQAGGASSILVVNAADELTRMDSSATAASVALRAEMISLMLTRTSG